MLFIKFGAIQPIQIADWNKKKISNFVEVWKHVHVYHSRSFIICYVFQEYNVSYL